jgi:signal transduction histidine kinase
LKRPPSVFMSLIQIAGETLALAETGTPRATVDDLPATRNNLLIEFVAPSFGREGDLKYQYKLEGADADWSAPTELRTVNYSRLAPGSYRFLVRATDQRGLVSGEPAVFTFRILPPLWQRWWFLTIAGIVFALGAYALHRYRVARLIDVERIRTRIATDLHDDIGSSLSQIAILSEVARNRVSRIDNSSDQELSLIARISRESVDAMSDIVWAINPQRDWLGDLVGRMRRLAGEIFPARDIEFEFTANIPEPDTRMTTDARRQIFLIFKECVNNIVRHSECTHVSIALRVEGWLVMKLADNGKGFDLATAGTGHGLISMQGRAERLGGELQIITNHDGTTVTFRVPLTRRNPRWILNRLKTG